MEMIAKSLFPYGGKYRRKGDKFEAPRRDATVLEKIGKAVRVPQRSPQEYETRVMVPQPAAPSNSGSQGVKPKRQYKRRDMTAKG